MNNLAPINVSIDTFQALVIEQSYQKLVILDISAEWCTPCKLLEPIMIKVASAYNKSHLLFAKLEAEDENMKIAGQFSVRGFPTVIAFVKGQEIDRFHSVQTPDFIRDFIDVNLEKFE